MNCYFHISTVFRMRRETLRVFLQLGRAPDLEGFPKDFVEQAELSLLRTCGVQGAKSSVLRYVYLKSSTELGR
jgi:hypothetical protein